MRPSSSVSISTVHRFIIMSRQILLATLATTSCLFGLNAAFAATLTGTVERISTDAFAFSSDDLTYTDGTAFSSTDVTLFCIEPTNSAPLNNTVYRFNEDTTGATLSGGSSSIAAINWFIDSYYESYFVNGTSSTQSAFQYGLWELSADYNPSGRFGNGVNAYNGQSRPARSGSMSVEYANSWQTIYRDFSDSLGTLSSDYRSNTYTITFLDTLRNGRDERQNLVAISELPTEVPAVPLPAAGWLLIGGIGALAAAKRRR